MVTNTERATPRLGELLQELNHSAQTVFPVTMDTCPWESIEAGVGNAYEERGPLIGVVHCAGVCGPFGPVSTGSTHDWANAISINWVGAFSITKAVAGRFQNRESTFTA